MLDILIYIAMSVFVVPFIIYCSVFVFVIGAAFARGMGWIGDDSMRWIEENF